MGYIYAIFRWLQGKPYDLNCWYDPREEEGDDAQAATCLLRFRHWGSHKCTPDSDIMIRLRPEEAARAAIAKAQEKA